MQLCENCTICCKLCNIKAVDSLRGDYCRYCVPAVGCKIYGTRPEQCKTFMCAWVQMPNAHIDLRPDNCGVMFEKIRPNIMVGTVVGKLKDITALVNRQVDAFCFEGLTVFLQQLQPYQFNCKLVNGMTKEEVIQALEEKAHDSTELHRRSE